MLAMSVAGVGHCALAAPHNNDFGEIINTGYAQGKNSLCALRDRYGFLWVGTLTGLYCFDGNGLQVFPHPSGSLRPAEGSNITAIWEHGEDIWFGSSSGLCVFDRKANNTGHFPYQTKYGVRISSPVQKIMDAGDGHIWILTHGQGLFVFDVKQKVLSQNSRHGAFYSDMAIGSDGRIYTVTLDGDMQIFNINGGFISGCRLPGYIADKSLQRMAAVGRDVIVSSNTALYRYDTATHEIFKETDRITGTEINAMLVCVDGSVLLGTDDGVWSYDSTLKRASRFTPPYNLLLSSCLSDNKVNALCYDADGSIIAVTPRGGISHLMARQQAFENVRLTHEEDSRNTVNVVCMSAEADGVWVGSKSGLSYYNPDTQTVQNRMIQNDGNAEITALDVDGDSLWIGTKHQGLMLYDNSTGNLKSYTYDANTPYAVISNDINKVYRTRQGEIFVLTNWGLCKYSPVNDNFTTLAEIDSHMPFIVMQEDGHGRTWTATANSDLYMRTGYGKPFRRFTGNALGNRKVSIMFLDSNGVLWAVTQDNNVFFFDEQTHDFSRLNIYMSKEYPIIFMEEDIDGCLWVGGASGGLAKVDADRHITYYSFRPHGDMIPATDVSCRLPDGRILFGSGNGFRIFNPREMRSDSGLVKAYIHSIRFPYLEDGNAELEKLGLDILLYTRDEVRLPYADNTFTLSFASARPGDMPRVLYDYMLEGVDKAWIRGAGHEVTYTDLQPGTYTFLLRPDSGADMEVRKLTIVIMPPWYRTWLAYTIYGVLAVLLIWGAVVLSRRRIRKHYQHRINELRIQKEREAFEGKMRFFVNLVHEIRTPLTLISLPLEQMSESVEKNNGNIEDNRKHIKSMRRNVNYLLGIINQLLDFRKAEHDKEVRLSRSHRDVKALLTDICRRFEHPMSAIGKEITLTMPEGKVFADIDPDKTDRVIMNLIGNAEKYSRKKVAVTLHEPANGQVRISVADDGPGIAPQERQHIFDTYYQIEGDNVSAALGTGLGLAYAKLIVKAHGGEISVENNTEGGATFMLSLPVNEGSFAADAEVSKADGLGKEAVEGGDAGEKVTVLLVDDNQELLATVSDAMGRSYNVVTASDGAEALGVIDQREDIDVVISDFMMPGMDGAELCRRVKSNVKYSHIPFIILTAKTDSEAKEEGMECGADVYIEKPFTIKQLRLQIANMLKTRELFYARMSSGGISAENPVADAPYLNRLDAEFLTTLNEYMKENVSDEEFSIDMMAEKMAMSRSSFYRKLKGVTGMTPVDYLKNFRLEYAAKLLTDGERVTEVAMLAGFSSSSYFAKCFKAKFGVIPKEYVASCQ